MKIWGVFSPHSHFGLTEDTQKEVEDGLSEFYKNHNSHTLNTGDWTELPEGHLSFQREHLFKKKEFKMDSTSSKPDLLFGLPQ